MAKDYSKLSREELIKKVKDLENTKEYGLVWEEKTEDVVEQCQKELPVLVEVKDKEIITDKDKPTNIIIEGDNYHALSVLNYTHAGKIDVIYIDPPFNTGAKNWKYNNRYVDAEDTFRHSKWLSFMQHRLELSKKLLKQNGVLICAIDDNEQAHLCVLLEELFHSFERHTITVVHNPKGVQGKNFSYTHEYEIFVIPKQKKIILDKDLDKSEMYISNLRNWGNESLRTDAKNCFYPIIVSDKKIIGFGEVALDNYHPTNPNEIINGEVYIWPIDDKGIERKWRYARQSVEQIKDILQLKYSKNGNIQVMIAKTYGIYKTVWFDKKYDSSEYGTKLLRKIIPNCDFNFPKSLYTVYDCLYAVIGNRPNALVLDYFAGSGTTGHAVLEMNKLDGGKRKFILSTNNENGIAETVCYPRIKKVIEGYSNIKGIPANLYYFKTDFVPKTKISDDTKYELVNRSTEMICLREDTFNKVLNKKYIKIFENENQYTAILFHLDQFEQFKKELQNLKKQIHIYVFSLTNDTYDDDFKDLKQKHDLCPIPESILEVYRKIFNQ